MCAAPVAVDDTLGSNKANSVVGYYDLNGYGAANQVGVIDAAGLTAVQLQDISAASLGGLDILFVQNESNGSYAAEFLNGLAALEAAVQNGLTLVFHDRYVSNAEQVLPGGGTLNIIRSFSDDSNIELVDDAHPIAGDGPYIVNDTVLDNGNSSSHGYIDAATLPEDSEVILSRSYPDEAVTIRYGFGLGEVFYSTIPLDHYLSASRPASGISQGMFDYATNLLTYASELEGRTVIDFGVGILQIDGDSLLANDTDPDGDPLVIQSVGATSALGASLTLNADGTITYDASALDLVLLDGQQESFTYTISDGAGGVDTATVQFELDVVDAPPQATGTIPDLTTATHVDFSMSFAADLFEDADRGGAITYSLQQANGLLLPSFVLFDAATRTLSIDPHTAPAGQDTILNLRVTATEEDGDSATQLFTLTIEDGNDVIVTYRYANGGRGDDLITNVGGSFASNLFGADGNDTIVGYYNRDQIFGGRGNDDITGGAGDDLLKGGSGDDILRGFDGDDEMFGGMGNDTLLANHDDDTQFGMDGDDLIKAGGGNDSSFGGNGNDTIFGNTGRDRIEGRGDDDYLDGGLGADLIHGNKGDDFVFGNKGDDLLFGGAGADTVNGGDGNDTLRGNSGDDVVRGAAGDDIVDGGAGNDEAHGGLGNDTIFGGGGEDTLFGFEGDDLLAGGSGEADDFVFGAGDGNDTITDYELGLDRALIATSMGNHTISAQGTDALVSFDSGDTILFRNVADFVALEADFVTF